MKIALLSPIAWRTPPVAYGPWEQVVSLLAESIHPETGAAEDKALFTYEAIPRATVLWLRVLVDDFRNAFPTKRRLEQWRAILQNSSDERRGLLAAWGLLSDSSSGQAEEAAKTAAGWIEQAIETYSRAQSLPVPGQGWGGTEGEDGPGDLVTAAM